MTHETPPADRRRIRVTGQESMRDVVGAVFADVRVMPLVVDLNPSLPATGALPAGTVVLCPSRAEAQAFARRMGFTLGFDERAGNGTARKRAWARLQAPARSAVAQPVAPIEAASKLLDTGIGAGEVARRLVGLCAAEQLEHFVGARGVDVRMAPVQRALELQLTYPRAHARLRSAIAVLDATTSARGLRALLAAAAGAPAATDAAFSYTLLPEPERRALLAPAGHVVALLSRADELARVERGARDLALAAAPDAAVLRSLVDAVVDGVEPLAGARLAQLGLARAWDAAVAHIDRLKAMLRAQQDVLARAGNDVVRTLARDEPGARLPRPWPLVVAVTRGLGPLAEQAGAVVVELGIGGLVRERSVTDDAGTAAGATPVVRATALQARAAAASRAHDDGAAIAERLAPRVAALFDSCRPLAGDHGPSTLRRARRRAHYEAAMAGASAPIAAGIAACVDDVLTAAARNELAGVQRLARPHVDAARTIASRVTGPLTLHQRRASELARAIVVLVMAADPQLGSLIARDTGREAFRQVVERHGGRVLSRACLAYVEAAA
jgi:hypothetical protein